MGLLEHRIKGGLEFLGRIIGSSRLSGFVQKSIPTITGVSKVKPVAIEKLDRIRSYSYQPASGAQCHLSFGCRDSRAKRDCDRSR
jgi:hypothetical protein